METVEVGVLEPFSPEFLERLNNLDNDGALEFVQSYLDLSIQARNRYEEIMMKDPLNEGARRCWAIDCNNILRFLQLKGEIQNEIS